VVWWFVSRLVLSCLWGLLVCYPDPRVLWQALRHTLHPPIDVVAVGEWASALPDDPAQIEVAVQRRIRYAVPWETQGVPWAVPPPADVLASGFGDCQSRAVVLASLLAAKGIPFQLRASLDHLWVDYVGKEPNAIENAASTLWTRPAVGLPAATPAHAGGAAGQSGRQTGPIAGTVHFRLPAVDLGASLRAERAYFWDAAPDSRKVSLAAGLLLLWVVCWRRGRVS
jgi:hypothetical protein